MIKELEINNFQSHEKTILEFDSGVNVIIGPSDSGKTSILRALHWLAWNRPLGDAFRSSWGGDTSVLAKFDNCQIERFKGKEDHYKLWHRAPKKEDKDINTAYKPIEFKAFGTEVPQEIQEALNISEINMQAQMDSPFLIADNPGEVSRHFNKVANIDAIDSSLRAVESWVRSINSDIRSAEEEIERHQKQLKSFDYLDQLESQVEVLEQLDSNRQSYRKQASQLKGIIEGIQTTEKSIQKKSKLLPLEQWVIDIEDLQSTKKKQVNVFDNLSKLVDKIKEVGEELENNQLIKQDESLVNALVSLYNKSKKVHKEATQLESKIRAIKGTQDAIETDLKPKLKSLEQTWHEKMPEVCPLCGQNTN